MAQSLLEIMELREIIKLRLLKFSNRRISQELGIHRNTVNKYVQLLQVSGFDDQELLELEDSSLRDLFPSYDTIDTNRYEKLSKNFSFYASELKKTGCTKLRLWEDYILQSPDGYGSSQFNFHLNNWLDRKKGSGKIIHQYGDKMFVDYTGKKLTIVDKTTGLISEVEVFVSILPASQYVFVEASLSQKREDFISSINNALDFYGGVPKVVTPDNLKSAVTKASKYEPVLNKAFKDQGLHYGFCINPTRSYSPRDKSLVEGAVKLIYQHVFYDLSKQTFFSLIQLNNAIQELLEIFNLKEMKTYGASRFKLFNQYEKHCLSALPMEKYELKEFKVARVQKMGYIHLSADKNYYSVPFRYIGEKVEIQYNQDTVDVFHQQSRIATHQRSFKKGSYNTIENHLASSHQFYSQWKPDFFLQQANELGESVYQLVSQLFAQAAYPEITYKRALGIIHLKSKYSKDRIDNACQMALENQIISYSSVKNILENNMDLQQSADDLRQIPKHNNIRNNYY